MWYNTDMGQLGKNRNLLVISLALFVTVVLCCACGTEDDTAVQNSSPVADLVTSAPPGPAPEVVPPPPPEPEPEQQSPTTAPVRTPPPTPPTPQPPPEPEPLVIESGMGTIIVPYSGTAQLQAYGSNDRAVATSDDGVFKLKAGTYRYLLHVINNKDAEGNNWSARTNLFPAPNPTNNTTFTLTEDEPIEYDVGGPYTVVCNVQKGQVYYKDEAAEGERPERGPGVTVSLKVTDRYDNPVSISGPRDKPIQFQARNAANRVVWSHNFEYG